MKNINPKRILCCGLNQAGKTHIAENLAKHLHAIIWDGDVVREGLGNTDFSSEGRIKQGKIIDFLSKNSIKYGCNTICSFIAPLEQTKLLFYPDAFIIWVDTVQPKDNVFTDTATIWQNPTFYHFRVTKKDNIDSLIREILEEYNYWLANKI